MAKQQQSKGKCFFCNQELTKKGMGNHLKACKIRLDLIDKAEGKKKKNKQLYHLVTKAAYSNYYWLHLEMDGNALLEDLDGYLRSIWLECCGHLSSFLEPGKRGNEIPMSKKISQILYPGSKLMHIYDWGTSSETEIECVGSREGKALTQKPIFLMARNSMPEHKCEECGKVADSFCWGCIVELGEWTPLCKKCIKSHECSEEFGFGKIFNSPRLGMCGYNGPAKPPY